jgi:hypothetical protein
MSESKEVALRPDQLPSTAGDAAPSWHQQGDTRGNENVTVEDLVIPRIEIAQGLSPCVDPEDPAYIEGCVVGTLFNSLTRELYGKSTIIVPVIFMKQYLLWRDRKEGGGFRGAHNTLIEAQEAKKELDKPEEWEAQETAQHFVFVLKGASFIVQRLVDGEMKDLTPARLKEIGKDGWSRKEGEFVIVRCEGVEQAMLSMSRTKLKVSRNWNSLIQMSKRARWAQAWEIGSVSETNNDGEKYQNFKVRAVGFTDPNLAKMCEQLYGDIHSGAVNVQMDTSDLDTGGEQASEEAKGSGEDKEEF